MSEIDSFPVEQQQWPTVWGSKAHALTKQLLKVFCKTEELFQKNITSTLFLLFEASFVITSAVEDNQIDIKWLT